MEINIDQNTVYFAGLLTLKQINPKLVEKKVSRSKVKLNRIDITKIQALDTAGAYFILKVLKDLELTKEDLVFDNHKDKNLIELVANNFPTRVDKENSHKSNIVFTSIYTLGKNTNNLLQEIKASIGFLGAILLGYLTLIRKPYRSFFL